MTAGLFTDEPDFIQSDYALGPMQTQADKTRFAHASMIADNLALSSATVTDALGFSAALGPVEFGPVEIGPAFTTMTGTICGETLLAQFTHPRDDHRP